MLKFRLFYFIAEPLKKKFINGFLKKSDKEIPAFFKFIADLIITQQSILRKIIIKKIIFKIITDLFNKGLKKLILTA